MLLFSGVVVAGSTYNFTVQDDYDWDSGFNISNTTVKNGSLETPRTKIQINESGSDWNSYQSKNGFSVSGDGINQSESWVSKQFGAANPAVGDIGGAADFDNTGTSLDLAVENVDLDFLRYNGAEVDGSRTSENDVISNAGNVFVDHLYADPTYSTTITCSGNEHTWEFGTTNNDNDASLTIDGNEYFWNEGETASYQDKGAELNNCKNGHQKLNLEFSSSSSDHSGWDIGADSPMVMGSNGTHIFPENAPFNEFIFPWGTPHIATGRAHYIDTVAIDTSTGRDNPSIYFATDSNKGEELEIREYDSLDNGFTSHTNASGYVLDNRENGIGNIEADLDGDGSYEFISATVNKNLGLVSRDGTKTQYDVGVPVTSVAAGGTRDVDDDGTAEYVFTSCSNCGPEASGAGGFIFHMDAVDFSGSVSDVQNTSIYAKMGDVGELHDWDADNVAEIPYRNSTDHVNYADLATSGEGKYLTDKRTNQSSFEPLTTTFWYDTEDNVNFTSVLEQYSGLDKIQSFTNLDLGGEGPYDEFHSYSYEQVVDQVSYKFNYSNASSTEHPLSVKNWSMTGERYPTYAEWNSSTHSAYTNDPTPDKMDWVSYPVNITNSSELWNQTENCGTGNDCGDHSYNLSVKGYYNDSWTAWIPASNLSQVGVAKQYAFKVEFASRGDAIGKTPKIHNISLEYVYPSYPETLKEYNKDLSTENVVSVGGIARLRTTIYDSDGEDDTQRVNYTVALPNGSTVQSGNVLPDGDIPDDIEGNLVEYNVSLGDSQDLIGTATYNVSARSSPQTTESGSFEIEDTTGPNITYTPSATDSGDRVRDWIFVNVSVEDTSGVDQVIEEFDGVNSSFTSNYGQYYWENHTELAAGQNYSFKAYANDSKDNWAVSPLREVRIESNDPVSITVSDPDNITYGDPDVPVDVLTSEPNDQSYTCNINWNGSKIGETNESSESFKDTISHSSNDTYTVSTMCTDSMDAGSSQNVTYTVDTTEETGGDSGGSVITGGSTTETIIRNVSTDQYSWTISGKTNSDRTSFHPVSLPGRSVNRSIKLTNTGDNTVEFDLQCISDEGDCQHVTLSSTYVKLPGKTGEETVSQSVWVNTEVPADASMDEVYRFSIRATDPEGNRGDVDFYVTLDRVVGGLFAYISGFANPVKLVKSFIAVLVFWFSIQRFKTWQELDGVPTVEFAATVVLFLVMMGLV